MSTLCMSMPQPFFISKIHFAPYLAKNGADKWLAAIFICSSFSLCAVLIALCIKSEPIPEP